MSALVRSELLKVRTTRSWWAYPIVIVLLSGLSTASEIGPASDAERGSVDLQLRLVEAAGVSALLALILGIALVTAEFRHGTITPTFLVSPVRERVVAAKAAAATVVAGLFAVLALVVIAGVGVTWLTLAEADLHLGDEDVGTLAAQILLAAVLWALTGLAVGWLVQSQVAALVGTLIWVFLAETLLAALLGLLDADGVAKYLPFRALDGADGTGGGDLLGYWPAVGVSLAWIAAIGTLGVLRAHGRDIT